MYCKNQEYDCNSAISSILIILVLSNSFKFCLFSYNHLFFIVEVHSGLYPQFVAVPEYVVPFCLASADKGYIIKHDSSIDI